MKTKVLLLITVAFATFNFQLFNTQLKAQVCFAPAIDFNSAGTPTSIISADFNGDAKADLAITNYSSNNVSILLGDSLGGFSSAVYFVAGNGPVSVISADFNGDTKVDLAVANRNSNNVSILLNDGLGGFGDTVNFVVGIFPVSVISADFNGDTKVDLAVANRNSNNVSVLFGNGSGGVDSVVNFSVGVKPFSIISADFNSDSKVDLAVVNFTDNNVSVLLGDGLGGFSSAVNYAVGVHPQSVNKSDFNADGKVDLVVVNSNDNNISVLLNDGLGGFSPAVNYAVGVHPVSVIGTDCNTDGKVDLVVANDADNNISILLGNGLGSFGDTVNFVVGANPTALVGIDFNGDTKIDLAVINGMSDNVSVLLNSVPPTVIANTSADAVCSESSVILTGGGATTYSWTSGVIDGVAFSPSSTASYTVTGKIAGCSNTATVTVVVNPLPIATFVIQDESSSLYCDGSIKANLSGGSGLIQAEWDTAQTILSNTDSIGALCPGSYILYLIDTNNCTNTYTQIVQPGTPPPIPPICMVTVDQTNTHNVVILEKSSLNLSVIDSFIVYREISTNNYQQIGSISKDSLCILNDTVNPSTTGYRYEVKTKSKSGVYSDFSEYHNSIYLTNIGSNFNWTPYQIQNNTTPVANYNIYRDDISNGNFQLIGNTTGNQFGYTDVNFSSFPFSRYYVEAVMTTGSCFPTRTEFGTSRSNIKDVGSVGVQSSIFRSIKIYPNPVNDVLKIEGVTGKTVLSLYDVVGKLVMEKEVENNTNISTSEFVDGVYTLLTETKEGRVFNKVVVSH